MANPTYPKPGTELSIKWTEAGPLIKVNGDDIGLLVVLGIIAGCLNTRCNIPNFAISSAVEHGRDLLDAISAHSTTVDMSELARQVKEAKHESP